MKFVIATQEINYLINKCQNVIAQKVTYPLLGNFLIEARAGELIITATDLTVGIRCTTEAKILEEGKTSVPAKKFASLIRELTAPNLEMNTDDNHVSQVISGTSKFKLHGMNPDEYPSLPDLSGATKLTLPQSTLRDVFFRTSFAVSRDDNRYALTGVFMNIENGVASFVGTDGKRLAKSHLSVDLDSNFSGGYIIPLKAVEEILKWLTENNDVFLYLLDDKVAVETDSMLIVTKLLSGDYPDVSRVIPDRSDTVVSLHREELMTLLRQIALFTPEKVNCSVRFSFVDGELKLDANNSEVGEGKVSMPVNYQGAQIDVAFNPNYFIEILRHNKGETVSLGLTDPFNPGLITDNLSEEESETKKGCSPLFVLMPMRLSGEPV